MADTNGLISIEEVVTRYLFKYKRGIDDYAIYVEHAGDCFQAFNLYDGQEVNTVKVTVDTTNKWIDMPDDMIGFNDLFVLQTDGRFWSCTEQRDIISTTTFTGLVEGRNSAIGEGADITFPKSDTYGGVGGVNDYNYTIDWKARRIYVLGITTETVALQYTSSGIVVGGTTYIPAMMIPVIDAYLGWKETYWIPALMRLGDVREKGYIKEELKVRNFINSLSYNSWHDLFLSLCTQAPIR
jgi:hypothetical protein